MDLANYPVLLEKKKELDKYVHKLNKIREKNCRVLIYEEYSAEPFIDIYPDNENSTFHLQGKLIKDVMIKHLEEKVSEIKKFIETL